MLSKAVAETVQALRDAGRLEKVDAAVVAACEMLSLLIDADPENDKLWREFRAYVVLLTAAGSEKGDDAVDRLLAALAAPVPAPLEHPQDS